MEIFAIRMDNLFIQRMEEWKRVTNVVKQWSSGDGTTELRQLGLRLEKERFRAKQWSQADPKQDVRKQHYSNKKRLKQLLIGVEEFQATEFYLFYLQSLDVEKYEALERVERVMAGNA